MTDVAHDRDLQLEIAVTTVMSALYERVQARDWAMERLKLC